MTRWEISSSTCSPPWAKMTQVSAFQCYFLKNTIAFLLWVAVREIRWSTKPQRYWNKKSPLQYSFLHKVFQNCSVFSVKSATINDDTYGAFGPKARELRIHHLRAYPLGAWHHLTLFSSFWRNCWFFASEFGLQKFEKEQVLLFFVVFLNSLQRMRKEAGEKGIQCSLWLLERSQVQSKKRKCRRGKNHEGLETVRPGSKWLFHGGPTSVSRGTSQVVTKPVSRRGKESFPEHQVTENTHQECPSGVSPTKWRELRAGKAYSCSGMFSTRCSVSGASAVPAHSTR